jgi:hypothetical protein
MGSIRQHCIATLSVAGVLLAACGSASAQTAVPLMKVSSAGTVGIGIDPGSGIPWAKLAIAGGNGNSSGPFLQFTTSSDSFPLLQVLPYTHDNVSLNFDSYYNGSWRRSIPDDANNGSYSIQKYGGKLIFNYAPASGGAGNTLTWTTAMSIDNKGCVRAGSNNLGGTCTSDERLKSQVAALPPSLDAVSRLRLVEFDYRREQFPQLHLPEGRQTGVIAQELQQVMPELVSTDDNGLLRVDYGRLDRRIQAAVVEMARVTREQQQQIATLRQELDSLRAQVAQRPAAAVR